MLLRVFCFLVAVAVVHSDCPPGFNFWMEFTKCVKFSNISKSWLDAQEDCRTLGGNLIYIQSGYENMVAANAAGSKPFWIGLSQLRSNVWSWVGVNVDTATMYTNWNTSQPDDASEQCAYVTSQAGTWIKDKCFEEHPYMCSVDPSSITPTPSPICPTEHQRNGQTTSSASTEPPVTTKATEPPVTSMVVTTAAATSTSTSTPKPPQTTTRGVSGILSFSLVAVIIVMSSV